jgi:phosphoheptose isomerase
MGNDIGFDIVKKSGTDKPFRVLPLTDNSAVITAIANDVGYENIFLNQLKIIIGKAINVGDLCERKLTEHHCGR